MFFIDSIAKIPGLTAFLQVTGSVLVFLQAALGMVSGLKERSLIHDEL